MPVYYVSTPEIDNPGRRDADPLAVILAARQHVDWLSCALTGEWRVFTGAHIPLSRRRALPGIVE